MRRVLKQRVRSAVIVTLKSGLTIRGVLWDHDDHALTLKNAESLTPGSVATIDGEFFAFAADVAYMQFV